MATLLDEFTNITKALNERKIDYAVCGGWAMAILGFPRATVDIDLLILTENLDEVWQIAQNFGYNIEGLPLSFHDGKVEIRRISKIDEETKTLITLDLLLVTEALKEVWNDRKAFSWNQGTVFSVSKDGLISLKTISGRLQDLADIERLENGN
ncbi:MAG: hypothetical protein MUF77_06295 [Leptospira sp.]|jgi:hypothetical protein|nr:hypothetical protein [Leptospira sp.]